MLSKTMAEYHCIYANNDNEKKFNRILWPKQNLVILDCKQKICVMTVKGVDLAEDFFNICTCTCTSFVCFEKDTLV